MYVSTLAMFDCRIWLFVAIIIVNRVARTSSRFANEKPNISEDDEEAELSKIYDPDFRDPFNVDEAEGHEEKLTKRNNDDRNYFVDLYDRRSRGENHEKALTDKIVEKIDDKSSNEGGEEVLGNSDENTTAASGLLNGIQNFFRHLNPKEPNANTTTTWKIDQSTSSTSTTLDNISQQRVDTINEKNEISEILKELKETQNSLKKSTMRNYDRKATFDIEIEALPVIVNDNDNNIIEY